MDPGQHIDHNLEAVKVFDRLAVLYQEKYMNVDAYADDLQWLLSRLQQRALVHDLACGPGNVSNYLLRHRPDLRLTGSDLSENMVMLAKAANPDAIFSVMDARLVHTLPGRYDAMLVSFLLPYLNRSETDALVGGIKEKLADDGYLYLAFIDAPYHTSGPQTGSRGDLIHMYFYNEEELMPLFSKYGFGISYKSDLRTVIANGAEVKERAIILQPNATNI